MGPAPFSPNRSDGARARFLRTTLALVIVAGSPAQSATAQHLSDDPLAVHLTGEWSGTGVYDGLGRMQSLEASRDPESGLVWELLTE